MQLLSRFQLLKHRNNKNPKIHTEAQKTLNKPKQNRAKKYTGDTSSQDTTGHNKDGMVLAQKQICGPVEQIENME